MPTQKKIFTVDNLTEKLKQAKALILADYSGLKVSQINELRTEIKKVGGEFEVVKNTLLCLAAKNAQFSIFPGLAKRSGAGNFQLEGPTVALWIYQDDIAPLKSLYAFIKKNDLPKVKTGFWQGRLITLEEITKLACLPGMDELRAKLVGQLMSPLYRLHWGLNFNIQKLILMLNKACINSQKGR